jgi:hypothetical protein
MHVKSVHLRIHAMNAYRDYADGKCMPIDDDSAVHSGDERPK